MMCLFGSTVCEGQSEDKIKWKIRIDKKVKVLVGMRKKGYLDYQGR